MKLNEAKMKKCIGFGHDWAMKDAGLFMEKICLRCGAKQYFFPEDEINWEVDDE